MFFAALATQWRKQQANVDDVPATGQPNLMAKFYQRRSGGVSKTLVFSDLVTTAGAVLTALVEAGVLSADSWAGPVLLAIGLITRVLRQTGPVPQPIETAPLREEPRPPATTADDYLKHGYLGDIKGLFRAAPKPKADDADERL